MAAAMSHQASAGLDGAGEATLDWLAIVLGVDGEAHLAASVLGQA
jgi:hypothetical protein